MLIISDIEIYYFWYRKLLFMACRLKSSYGMFSVLQKLFDYIDKDPKELKAGEEDVNR